MSFSQPDSKGNCQFWSWPLSCSFEVSHMQKGPCHVLDHLAEIKNIPKWAPCPTKGQDTQTIRMWTLCHEFTLQVPRGWQMLPWRGFKWAPGGKEGWVGRKRKERLCGLPYGEGREEKYVWFLLPGIGSYAEGRPGGTRAGNCWDPRGVKLCPTGLAQGAEKKIPDFLPLLFQKSQERVVSPWQDSGVVLTWPWRTLQQLHCQKETALSTSLPHCLWEPFILLLS